eukprot:TRINITY_DN1237_c1_g1_i1.p1 TRINITY_DN1237_c1_g1~~TRINITY_DN1237_c1_g1_i1.p1  ORF type:complete len:161 (+),score=15.80 TRINITY_DN1237_c1_g1_i1:438-920(+)
MDDLGALVLDPTEPFSKRRFYPPFNTIHLVTGDTLLPLHLGVVEAPRLHGRGRGRPLGLTARGRRQVWRRRRSKVAVGGAESDAAVHDLQLPVAGGPIRPETAVEIGHGRGRKGGVLFAVLGVRFGWLWMVFLGFWGVLESRGGGEMELRGAFGWCWIEM